MRFLAFTFFFASFSAMAACPNLAGTYSQCTSATTGEVTNGSTVTETTAGGITTYTIVSMNEETQTEVTGTLITDGVARTETLTDEETGMGISLTTKASCMGTALMYEGTVEAQGQTIANFVTHVTKSGSKMSSTTTGTSMDETINDTEICE